jgi:hypothetical protein
VVIAAVAAVAGITLLAGVQLGEAAGTASRRLTVKLEPVAESGVSGRVRFESRDGISLATVSVNGVSESGYLVTLRRGSCLAYGALPETPLGIVKPGEKARTAVETPLVDLRTGDWVAAVHDAANLSLVADPSRAVACGILKPLPGVGTSDLAVTGPPATGIGEAARRAGGEATAVLLAVLGLASLTCGFISRQSRRVAPVDRAVIAAGGGMGR